MMKLFSLLLVLFFISCGSNETANITLDTSNETSNETGITRITPQSIISKMEKRPYKEGELLVKFKSGVIKETSRKLHSNIGASVKKRFHIFPNLEHIILPKGISVENAIHNYMKDPAVEYAVPNYIIRISEVPNDPYFSLQWALFNTFQPGTDIRATDAWNISKGSSNIIIAVIDTGIDYNHPDLSPNIWTNNRETNCNDGIDNDKNGYVDDCIGWNFTFTDKNGNGSCDRYPLSSPLDENCHDPLDDNGHGTHVAGIIGAVGDNATGITGIMWNVKLMPLKIFQSDGTGEIAHEIEAIDYAVRTHKKYPNSPMIINASFGSSSPSLAEREAIASAGSAGILYIAAAGNGGGSLCDDGNANNNDITPCFPASHSLPNIISVAATGENDSLAPFSNFGINSVDVAAPGVNILSTSPAALVPIKYSHKTGTSMATAHVTGLAGLLYGYYSNFTYTQIRNIILNYVDIKPFLTSQVSSGGRINAYNSLSSLWTPVNLSAAALSSSQISLTWTDRATDEDGYKIERREKGNTYSEIEKTGENIQSFTDSSLIDGTTYFYRIKAYNTIGESPDYPGNETSAVTLLNPPTDLIATAVSSSEVKLTWKDNSNSEDGYKIERRPSGSSEWVLINQLSIQNINTYADSGLSPSTIYSYRVKAFNSVAPESDPSNVVSETTLATSGNNNTNKTGGGGCSVGTRQNTPTTVANFIILMLPVLCLALLRMRK